jgi:hypothetical protein
MKPKLSRRNVQRRREGTVRAKVGSLKYAATKIGCRLPTLYDLIQGGKLRSYHIGRVHRVRAGGCSLYCTSGAGECPRTSGAPHASVRLT